MELWGTVTRKQFHLPRETRKRAGRIARELEELLWALRQISPTCLFLYYIYHKLVLENQSTLRGNLN
jgi:hypothetical protein